MAAIVASDALVDRCDTHGVWLDAGELGRLLHAPATEELQALYKHIAPDETMPEIAARKAIREAERMEQRREAADAQIAARIAEQSERVTTALEIVQLERELEALRAQVRSIEAALAAARARVR
jgi:Zn-finger nucleic acid-binding protein